MILLPKMKVSSLISASFAFVCTLYHLAVNYLLDKLVGSH